MVSFFSEWLQLNGMGFTGFIVTPYL